MKADRGLIQVGGHGLQRLIHAERHVPGLAGEDREDRRQFQSQHLAGEQVHEEHDGEGQEPQDRHRLQHVQHRHQDQRGPPAFGCGGAVGESEQQRGCQRREHAQCGANRVFRQVHRVQGDFGGTGRVDPGQGAFRDMPRADQNADDAQKRHRIPDIGQAPTGGHRVLLSRGGHVAMMFPRWCHWGVARAFP